MGVFKRSWLGDGKIHLGRSGTYALFSMSF